MKTKTNQWSLLHLFIAIFALLLISSCEKEDDEITVTHSTVSDIEGNVYPTIRINNGLEWMAKNLKTTKYSNNTPITYPGNDNIAWSTTTQGAYAWYNNDVANKDAYGALYNGFAVTNTAGLCPTGWRIPTKEDFQDLIDILGGLGNAGAKLKSDLTEPAPHPRWDLPNTGATNESGFSAVPSGIRYGNGNFNYLGKRSDYWTSSPNLPYTDGLYFYNMHHDNKVVGVSTTIKNSAFAIRCVKDH